MTLFDFWKIKESVGKSADEIKRSLTEKAYETKVAINAAMSDERGSQAVFSVRDSLRIIYCLMLIDGAVAVEEASK